MQSNRPDKAQSLARKPTPLTSGQTPPKNQRSQSATMSASRTLRAPRRFCSRRMRLRASVSAWAIRSRARVSAKDSRFTKSTARRQSPFPTFRQSKTKLQSLARRKIKLTPCPARASRPKVSSRATRSRAPMPKILRPSHSVSTVRATK